MADVLAGLQAEPDNGYLLCLKGRLLASHGSMAAAREALSAALHADPGLAEGWAIMGQLAYESADLVSAIDALDRAIALHDAPEMRYNRAVVHQAAGHPDAAVEDLNAVLASADGMPATGKPFSQAPGVEVYGLFCRALGGGGGTQVGFGPA
jgi:tetratricopeptide (TPR) repeat protein